MTLSQKRKALLIDIARNQPGLSCQGVLGLFLERYFASEAIALKIQSYYQTDTGKSNLDKIQITQLNAALAYFSIEFQSIDIKTVFHGGPGKQGVKSARQLRNGYVHSLNSADRVEIEANSKHFVDLMDSFIQMSVDTSGIDP
jgi:hypothetical protein